MEEDTPEGFFEELDEAGVRAQLSGLPLEGEARSKPPRKPLVYAPWWDSRTEELSSLFEPGSAPLPAERVGWLSHAVGTPRDIVYDVDLHAPEERKRTEHRAKRSRGELGEDEALRTFKIRVDPTAEQKRAFQRWFGVSRFAYNLAADAVARGGPHAFEPLRDSLLKGDNPYRLAHPWFFEKGLCDKSIQTEAIHELCSAIGAKKAQLEARGQKLEPNPRFQFRTRRDPSQRFTVDSSGGIMRVTWDDWGFQLLKRQRLGVVAPHDLRDFREFKRFVGEHEVKKTVTLKYEAPNRYFLLFPAVRKRRERDKEAIVALDPGVHTFQAGYDSLGRFSEFGTGDIGQILVAGKKIDRMQSLHDLNHRNKYESEQEKKRARNKRRNLKRKMARARDRIRNRIRDCHWKLAHHLCSEYGHVMISRFRVSEMTKRVSRKIGSETVRQMTNWSHYTFRQRLKHKAELTGTRVYEVGEHYTSKGCGRCGKIHWKLGGNRVFQCPHCGFRLGRDHNGARNIFLMNLERSVGKIDDYLNGADQQGWGADAPSE